MLHDLQQAPTAPDVVALPVQVLTRRLPLLLLQLSLLLPNPGKFADREGTDRADAQVQRGRDADPAMRGMNAQMDVLDVLLGDLDR